MKGKYSFLFFVGCLTLFVAYFISGVFGLKLTAVSSLATSVWAPSGIALAFLLRFGFQYWPSIFLAATSVNLYMGASISSALFIGTGNTLEAVTAFYLINQFCKPYIDLNRLPHIVSILILGSGLSTVISASFGVLNLWLTSKISSGMTGFTFLTWWLGDAMGILLITPFFLVWTEPLSRLKEWLWCEKQKWWRIAEFIILIELLTCASVYIFMDVGVKNEILSPHFIFPLLIWSAIRFGQRGTTLSFLIISIIAIAGTAFEYGPFGTGLRESNLLNLQGFLTIVSVSALILGAIIEERRKSERLLEEKAEELLRSNSELQQFASLASHDLQEPLRTISIRMQLLQEHLSYHDDSEVEEQINFCISATRRMQSLILALLNYARAGKNEVSFSEVDLNQEIPRVLELMQSEINNEHAQITFDIFPKINGNRLLLGQVFQNLISNSLKFRSSEKPQIHIGIEDLENEYVFSVKDNGIGFATRHSENIFKIFRRLHSEQEISGTGIGLALCKKIIEQHRGRIWSESEVGKGSTFYFSIPKNEI